MDGFEQISSKEAKYGLKKEAIEAKYANRADVKDKLLEYEAFIYDHNNKEETRKADYRQKLETLYNPLIEKNKTDIQTKTKEIALREETYRQVKEAAEAGDERAQRIANTSLSQIEEYKGLIVETTKEIEKIDNKRSDISDLAIAEKSYNSLAEVIGELYESSLADGASKYFNQVVLSGTDFIKNMNTTIGNDVELFSQIKSYCDLREKVDIYISKRSSIFGKFGSKGKMRLRTMKSLKSLLDEHEGFLQNKYDTLLATGRMSYIDSEDNFRIPRTVDAISKTEYAKRIAHLEFHKNIQEYKKGDKSLNQNFLDTNANKPDFKMSNTDSRFSQAFTCLRFNTDGTFNNQKDREIANLYIDCFSENKEVRKQALENVIKNFCTNTSNSLKELLKDLYCDLNGDKVKVETINILLFKRNYQRFYMLNRMSINFGSLLNFKSGKAETGNGKEWDDFAVEVFNEKELEAYWKEANYYLSAAVAAFHSEIERHSANYYIDFDNLNVNAKPTMLDKNIIDGRNELFQENLKNAYRELNS